MGFFKRNTSVTTQPAPQAPSGSIASRIGASGGAMVDQATRVYKQNPKMVGGIALLASALLLNRMRGRVR